MVEEGGRGRWQRKEAEEGGRGRRQRKEADEGGRGGRQRKEAEEGKKRRKRTKRTTDNGRKNILSDSFKLFQIPKFPLSNEFFPKFLLARLGKRKCPAGEEPG